MAEPPLAGCGVLVTRPEGQGDALAAALAAAGATTVDLPTLALVPVADDALEARIRDVLPAADWVFFVSPNAVRHGLALIRRAGVAWPHAARVASVGSGTTAALAAEGVEVDVEPASGAGSEPLLRQPPLARLDGSRAVILRGEGGRELLADILRQRGARVAQLEVYRRQPAGVDPGPARAGWREGWLQYTIVTSVSGLSQLLELAGADLPRLLDTRLVTVSERIALAAREAGFRQPALVAADPEAATLVAAIEADFHRHGAMGDS